MSKQISTLVSDETYLKLKELKEKLGVPVSKLIEIGIKELESVKEK